LKPGTYQLKEIEAPVHYDLNSQPIWFTISEDQTTVINVTAKNSLKKGSVILTKVDENKKLLEGAIFSLQDEKGKVIPVLCKQQFLKNAEKIPEARSYYFKMLILVFPEDKAFRKR
jgi:Prealbumin-like fold domain